MFTIACAVWTFSRSFYRVAVNLEPHVPAAVLGAILVSGSLAAEEYPLVLKVVDRYFP